MMTINKMKFVAIVSSAFLSSIATAAVTLTQISQGDFEQVSRELSGNFTHTAVSGASSLGTVLGFQLGVIGGVTKTPYLDSLVQRSGGSGTSQIPHGGLLGQVSIPMGVTFEGLILPSVGSADFKAKNTSLAVKWTLTSLILDLPVDVAVKGMYTMSSLDTQQTVSGGQQNLAFRDKMLGFEVLVSKTFAIVEPYFGLIQNRADVDLTASGSGNVFNNSFTTSNSASVTTSSWGYTLGAELRFLFLSAGAEYTRIFGVDRYTAKLAFTF